MREAGVRAAIPGRRGLRGPGAAKAAGWPAQDRQQAGGRGAERFPGRRLDATSFFPQPFEVRVDPGPRPRGLELGVDIIVKGLILAQNERWRRGLGMQVERAWLQDQVSGARVSKATVTNPKVGYSRGKLRVIPSDVRCRHRCFIKALAPWDGPSWY